MTRSIASVRRLIVPLIAALLVSGCFWKADRKLLPQSELIALPLSGAVERVALGEPTAPVRIVRRNDGRFDIHYAEDGQSKLQATIGVVPLLPAPEAPAGYLIEAEQQGKITYFIALNDHGSLGVYVPMCTNVKRATDTGDSECRFDSAAALRAEGERALMQLYAGDFLPMPAMVFQPAR